MYLLLYVNGVQVELSVLNSTEATSCQRAYNWLNLTITLDLPVVLTGVLIVIIAVRSPAPAVDPSTKAKLPLEVELKLLFTLANQLFKLADVGIVEVITQFKDPVALLFVIVQSLGLLKSEDHSTKLVDGNVVIKTL